MKIGLIGSNHTKKAILSMVNRENTYIDLVVYPDSIEEVVNQLDKIQDELDGILFTGARSYMYACRHASAKIPWVCLKRSFDSICYALIRAMQEGNDIHKITYDVHGISLTQMYSLLSQTIGLQIDQIELFPYCETKEYQDYLCSDMVDSYSNETSEYHIEKLRSGHATICISGSPTVVSKLKQKGYPVYLLESSEEMVNAALNELRLRHQLHVQKEQHEYLATVLSLSLHLRNVYNNGNQGYQHIHSTYQAEITVYSFAQSIGAAVEKQSSTQYLIYSTKAELALATADFTKIKVAEDILLISGIEYVTLGIGLDETFGEAKRKALQGDEIAKKQNNSCYYLLEKTASPAGPFVIVQTNHTKEFGQTLMERIAAETNVNIAILTKLVKAQRQYGFNAITAVELSEMCGMTISNINRIIIKLESKGYAEVVGTKAYADTGRPRRLVVLRLTPFTK